MILHEYKYKDGDTRWVKKFAWFPVRIQRKLIWLENFYQLEEYGWLYYNTWTWQRRQLETPNYDFPTS